MRRLNMKYLRERIQDGVSPCEEKFRCGVNHSSTIIFHKKLKKCSMNYNFNFNPNDAVPKTNFLNYSRHLH